MTTLNNTRRAFLQYLAASPLLAASASLAADGEYEPLKGPRLSGANVRAPDPMIWKPYDPTYLLKRPEDALDVFEFEPVAHSKVPGAHFGFLSTGADDEGSLRANRQDIAKFGIRPRRLMDVTQVDASINVFGQKWSSPFFLCPIGSQKMYNPEGEIPVARASGKRGIMQVLSTYANCTIGEAREARGGLPAVLQLYQQQSFEITKAVVDRAEREGSPAVLVTVDSVSGRKDMTFERAARDDTRLCVSCHEVAGGNPKRPRIVARTRPQLSEVSPQMWENVGKEALTWEYLKRLRGATKLPIYAKGIMSPEDAALCVKYGLNGVYISNHGARAEDTSTSTISVLPDVVKAVKGKIPVFIDGGFRRGMDILKALALGATAVGVGRPYVWGLAAFGEPGVAKVLDLLNAEFIAAMQQVGARKISDLNPGLIHPIL